MERKEHDKRKVMLVFGTRPEAIKMCPLVNELKTRENLQTVVCVTGQHRQMLDQVLETFQVIPDYDLSIMKERQTLFDVTTNILNRFKEVLEIEKPDVVLVHGDTSTTFVTALTCFYLQIPVGHVEAGLRTYNIYSPYPEEFNRQAVSIIASYNFAPTELSRQNLIQEGKKPESIYALSPSKRAITSSATRPASRWSRTRSRPPSGKPCLRFSTARAFPSGASWWIWRFSWTSSRRAAAGSPWATSASVRARTP